MTQLPHQPLNPKLVSCYQGDDYHITWRELGKEVNIVNLYLFLTPISMEVTVCINEEIIAPSHGHWILHVILLNNTSKVIKIGFLRRIVRGRWNRES